jgi:hypothetical protein
MTRENNAPWFTKAGAATSIVPLSHFVGGSIFALSRATEAHSGSATIRESLSNGLTELL